MAAIRALRENLAFVLVAVVEVVLIGAVLWAIYSFEAATERRSVSRGKLVDIDAALIAVVDAETGERGYVISGNEQFLEPYLAARERLNAVITQLGVAVDDDPRLSSNFGILVPLINDKVASMEVSIEARRSRSEEASEAEVIFGEGKRLMDEIRDVIAEMRLVASEALASDIREADRIGRFIGISSVTLAVASLALVGWLFFSLRRQQESSRLRHLAEAKDEFVGFVSHELRTPISVVAGNARLLEQGGDDGDMDMALSEIKNSAERLQDIVETLLSLARAEAGEKLEVEPILLQRIIQRAAREHRFRYPESTIHTHAPDALPAAIGNRRAVEQILLNLLSNAEKYGDGGPIEIEVSQSGENVIVSVVNTGPRLGAEEFSHVFEPFFRSPSSAVTAPGVGLGLTVCHRLVSAQGGRMSASARPGGGATFRFSLLAVDLEEQQV